MMDIVTEKKWVRAGPAPRSLRDRSRYDPHQSTRERMRRVGQLIREGAELEEPVFCLYVDYSTTKAAGGDLTKFIPGLAEAKAEIEQLMSEEPQGLINEGGGLSNVQVLPETGPDTTEGA